MPKQNGLVYALQEGACRRSTKNLYLTCDLPEFARADMLLDREEKGNLLATGLATATVIMTKVTNEQASYVLRCAFVSFSQQKKLEWL